MIVSGHSHTTYPDPVYAGNAVLVSPGAYLTYLGRLDLTVSDAGKVTCQGVTLLPCDETVASDAALDAVVEGFYDEIEAGYLRGQDHNEVIAHNSIYFPDLDTMYSLYEELPMADLIADSYLAAYRAQDETVDVAIVGMGTIRGALDIGDVTVANAFEVCSLGVGSDGSAGHPLVSAWITGSELKLLAEVDAFLGQLNSAYKLNYAGLEVTVNTARIPFDRVTSMTLLCANGAREPIRSDELYRVCGNLYAVNMMSSIKKKSFGIFDIKLKDAEGNVVTDTSSLSLKDSTGREVKEWEGFRDYLASFDKVDGVPEVPERYASAQGRKIVTNEGGLAIFSHPGTATLVVLGVCVLLVLIIVLIVLGIRRHIRKRRARRQG